MYGIAGYIGNKKIIRILMYASLKKGFLRYIKWYKTKKFYIN